LRSRYRLLTYSIVLAILLSLIYSGCGEKNRSIAEVRDNPQKYKGEIIRVKGQVTKIFEAQSLEKSIYQISDGENSLWVKLSRPADKLPKKDDKIEVSGEIITGSSLKDKTYGVVLIEIEKVTQQEEKMSEK